jgi:hypothetical protein
LEDAALSHVQSGFGTKEFSPFPSLMEQWPGNPFTRNEDVKHATIMGIN